MQTFSTFAVFAALTAMHVNALAISSKVKVEEHHEGEKWVEVRDENGQWTKLEEGQWAQMGGLDEYESYARIEDVFGASFAPGEGKDMFAGELNVREDDFGSCGQGRALSGFTHDGYCFGGKRDTNNEAAKTICIERSISAGRHDFCRVVNDREPNCHKFWPCGPYRKCSIAAGEKTCTDEYKKCPVHSFCISPNNLDFFLTANAQYSSEEQCDRLSGSIICASTHSSAKDVDPESLTFRCLNKKCVGIEDAFEGVAPYHPKP